MKKLYYSILLAVFMLSLFLLACKNKNPANNDPSKSSRFVTVENTLIYRIVADKETGVMYAVSIGGYNSGNFTLLVDREGKPLIWEGADMRGEANEAD